MVFSSYVFLFAFLPAVLALYYLAPRFLKAAVLTLASYVFYGWWRPDFMSLMVISTVLDFFCGKRIHQTQGPARRDYLLLSMFVNLGLLAYFKYMNFGVDTLNGILAGMGQEGVTWPHVVLPIGISFYTFQTMSYTIDIYRGVSRPQERFIDFACYVALFPQLVAGPIVRYNTLAEQLRERTHTMAKFALGALYFELGFAKKVILADGVAPLADAAFDTSLYGQPLTVLGSWIGTLAYTLQIYFDFSGYSDMAIGLGMMFGFVYPVNFDSPYKSQSITEFWRRWHISLSSWFRDYLYIPLGGNQKGSLRTYVNLSAVFLLCGLWHGAAWTFIVWGAYQGLWLIIERFFGRRPIYALLPYPLRVLCTFFLAMIGWVFFRAVDMDAAWRHLGAMFGVGVSGGLELGSLQVRNLPGALMGIGLAIAFFAPNSQECLKRPSARLAILAAVLFLLAVAKLFHESYSPFLYFQF